MTRSWKLLLCFAFLLGSWLVAAAAPPALRIQRSSGNTVLISWPTNSPGHVLQCTTNLLSQAWAVSASVPVVQGGLFVVTESTLNGNKFYRTSDGQTCSINVVGFVGVTVPSGQALLANPLNGTNNLLNTILPLPDSMDGAQVFRWNVASQGFDVSLFIAGFGWLDDGGNPTPRPIDPGEGFFLQNPGPPQRLVFVGEVPQGVLSRSVPGGGARSLLGSLVPVTDDLTGLGYPAADDDQALVWNTLTQSYKDPYLHIAGFGWTSTNPDDPGPGGPIIPVATGFFIIRTGPVVTWMRVFSVACSNAPQPIVPVITEVSPLTGGEGTQITIVGDHFGNDPDNLCVVLNCDGRFIDIEVLTVTPTQIVGRLGVVPPLQAGLPCRVMVGLGNGRRRPVCPDFADVLMADDNWIWRGDAVNAAQGPIPFIPVVGFQPAADGPALFNFHSGGPMAGMLTVTLDREWGSGSRFCINARIHGQGSGADTRITSATFTGNGNRFDCARRICDVLIKAFASHPTRPLVIQCTVLTNLSNAVIKVTLPGTANIDGGNIDILQKAPPPVVTGLWDIENRGIWRKEIRRRELARWYRHYEWRTDSRVWFNRRAEGLWIGRAALSSFTCQSHCLYRFPDGRVWVIWRTFRRVDLRRFWVHYRFWAVPRANPLIDGRNPDNNRMAMSMDDVQMVLPMTPEDPNPATPFNEAVMIVDENGQQHFQGEPGFVTMPDIAGNPNGFQLAGTAQSTHLLPPAADRVQDPPMIPMPGMAQLQPGVIIQWLVDRNGNVLVDHDTNGWPDRLTDPHALGGQKHQGLIAPATGVANNQLPVEQGNTPLQLYCWELDPNGEVRGAAPGQDIIGPPVDLNGDGLADNAIGAPVPMEPTVRELVVDAAGIREVRDTSAKPVDVAVTEEGPPTPAELAAFNANMAAQIPGFVPLQPPFSLCIRHIDVRRIWGIDRRYVFDTWRHHWKWQMRHHITLSSGAHRIWLGRVALANFMSSHHHHVVGQPPVWTMFNLTHVRFFRVCYRVLVARPNELLLKVDQMHVVVPEHPEDPNSRLVMLSTQSDENRLFQEVPPAVLAGLQPDPLPIGPDGVFVEPIDPVAGTLDVGLGGTGVLGTRPQEARGMLPGTLVGNEDNAATLQNNQLQLYCWVLEPNGTIARDTFTLGGGLLPAAPVAITLAVTPTPAIPEFVDDQGNTMENATMFATTVMNADNQLRITPIGGGQARLEWDGPGQLVAANIINGAYTDVAGGASSPVVVPLNQARRFYQVRR